MTWQCLFTLRLPAVGALIFFMLVMSTPLFAWTWDDLWLNKDEQGAQLLSSGQADVAAVTFHDQTWRAVAAYRAGQYAQAAQDFAKVDTPLAHYNRGNALAQLGDYKQALAEYETALAQQPDFPDAVFNRDLLKKLLQQQQQKQDQEKSQQQQASRAQSSQQPSPSSAEQQAQQQQSSAAEQQQSAQQTQSQHTQQTEQSATEQDTQQQISDEQQQQQSAEAKSQQANQAEAQQQQAALAKEQQQPTEQQQSLEQWLQRVPDNPGGLLRQKFLRDYQRRTQ
jgi:Ca-activated chloride channel homolog